MFLKAASVNVPQNIMIYDNGTFGVPCSSDGYSVDGGTDFNATTFNADNFVVTGTASPSKAGCIGTDAPIDLTPYSTLRLRGRVQSSEQTYNQCAFGVYSSKAISGSTVLANNVVSPAGSATDYTIDITNVNEPAYISVNTGFGSNRSFTVYEIELEL